MILVFTLALIAFEPKQQFDFANQLFILGDYEGAAREFHRFISFYSNDQKVKEALLLLGKSLLYSGKEEDGIKVLIGLKNKYPEKASEVLLALGNFLFYKKEYTKARKYYMEFLSLRPSEKVRFMVGRTFLYERRFEEAKNEFRHISENASNEGLKSHADFILKKISNYKKIPSRSPVIGGMLSALIPGLGQAYSRRALDGLYAFILNGIFIGGATIAFMKDEIVTGITLSLLGLPFYAGNIYNAVLYAKKFNQREEEKFIQILDRGHVEENGRKKDMESEIHSGGSSIGLAAIYFYKKFISPQRLARCVFKPSCSEYGHQSIREEGLFKGILLIGARLLRCNASAYFYYPIINGFASDELKESNLF